MKTIDFSYFIERYNAGEMDDAEKKWFRKELEENKKLRHEVDLRRRTDTILKEKDIISLRNKLTVIEKNREANIPAKSSRKPVNMKYAAAIAAMVLIGGFALFRSNSLSNEEILNKYYKTYEVTTPSRSYSASADPDYIMAMDYYKIHDYRKAALYFTKVLENDPEDMESHLLHGLVNFENSNYPEAERSFGKVIDNKDNMYTEDARWYLSLCYIKTNDQDKAMEHLAIINKSKSIYRRDARKILRRLK
jgi:tetratricopeptide (TPR) repeat protein